jgi:hypothetical protein
MKELEERLPKKQFIRVHKSFIIPISRITGIEGNLLAIEKCFCRDPDRRKLQGWVMEIIRGKMIQ